MQIVKHLSVFASITSVNLVAAFGHEQEVMGCGPVSAYINFTSLN